MLESNDKEKVSKYIDKVIKNIYADVKRNMDSGMSNRQIIDSAVELTVNKITPESKMVLSSTYNMLMGKTLTDVVFQNPQNKAMFYSADIMKELNAHFSFDIPEHIDYEESFKLINKWTEAGAVVVAGGVVSVRMKNVIPVIVSVVIAGLILYLLRDQPVTESNQDINTIIKEYLKNVKNSMMSWVDEISAYYDKRVEEIKKEIG